MQSETAERLRKAVTTGAYWEVDQLLGVYRREVEASWKASNPVDRQTLATEVTSLLQWARHSILASRSHTQHRLARLSRQGAYVSTGLRPIEQLELEA
jgi:hypothetical protein